MVKLFKNHTVWCQNWLFLKGEMSQHNRVEQEKNRGQDQLCEISLNESKVHFLHVNDAWREWEAWREWHVMWMMRDVKMTRDVNDSAHEWCVTHVLDVLQAYITDFGPLVQTITFIDRCHKHKLMHQWMSVFCQPHELSDCLSSVWLTSELWCMQQHTEGSAFERNLLEKICPTQRSSKSVYSYTSSHVIHHTNVMSAEWSVILVEWTLDVLHIYSNMWKVFVTAFRTLRECEVSVF